MQIGLFCRIAVCSGALFGCLFLGACGGSSSAPNYPSNVSVTVSPTIASLAVNATQQFTATTNGFSATPYWSVPGSTANGMATNTSSGTISSTGLYTAPSAPPVLYYGGLPGKQGYVTVTGKADYACPSILGCSTGGTQTFQITAPAITVGFIPPYSTKLDLNAKVQLQPWAVGSTNTSYTLQVNGVTGGSLGDGTIVQDASNAGVYTAPSAYPMMGKVVTITVISVADPTKSANLTLTLN